MFCPQCGANNSDEATFCLRCGVRLTGVRQGTAPPTPILQAAVVYAGFWRRFGASIIDAIVTGVVVWPLSLIVTLTRIGLGSYFSMGFIFLLYPLIIVGQWLYYALMESSSRQGTLGKMALRIIVTDLDGKRISFGKASGRYFGKIISGIILYIGFIMIAFTEKKQGLHDMLASTLVVMK